MPAPTLKASMEPVGLGESYRDAGPAEAAYTRRMTANLLPILLRQVKLAVLALVSAVDRVAGYCGCEDWDCWLGWLSLLSRDF
jgi:hypothetical protein